MSLPIRTLPIVEHWDCRGCATCCRGTIFALSEADLALLREQAWEKHPDFKGVKILQPHGLFKKTYSLAKRKDGTCVFLDDKGLCRIHGEFGFDAKPLVCRMAPLQLVPLDDRALLTVRRYCPTGAADEGQPLEEHLATYRKMAEEKVPPLAPAMRPPITRRCRRSWHDTHRVLDALERLMLDDRFPLVRRLVHGLEFCDYLDQCKLHRLDGSQFAELVPVLEEAAVEGAAELFASRTPPRRTMAGIFRQICLEYLRLHPGFVIEASWTERWRLVRAALAFSRGKGAVPYMHGSFPETTFANLEEPL
ncbi:MAG: YkgJ family cysteine cluster protein, partial [Pirellulales bacterium]|nr:YkgJ family cysteine cluster protein [Pirellulales bacterium]